MSNTIKQMTAQIPSGFSMPTGGHTVDAISGRTALSGVIAGVVRDRRGYALGTAHQAFPGSLAWSPPTS